MRRRWRQFRGALRRAALLPPLAYGAAPGWYRFSGTIESVQGDDRIWIRSGRQSVSVHLAGVPLYLLPRQADRRHRHPDASPRIVYWKDLFALVEGTGIFVAGEVQEVDGTVAFTGNQRNDPLVIVYDCPDDSVVKRGIWTGRQRNEYWNPVTVPALLAGVMAQVLLTVVYYDTSRVAALAALVASVIPFLPLAPPGVAGYYVYRRMWRAARRRRAVCDVLRIGAAADIHRNRTAQRMRTTAHLMEIAAVLALAGGVALNAYLAAVVAALTLFSV